MSRKSALREEIRQTRAFRNPQEEAILGILRTADLLRRRLGAVFESRGLTSQQYNVLRILRGARPEPLPTMEIAGRMLEKTPGITRLIDRLEAKGLVSRERRGEDRRCVHCSITPAGLELLSELDAPVAAENDEMMSMLGDEEAKRLIATLDAIRAGNG